MASLSTVDEIISVGDGNVRRGGGEIGAGAAFECIQMKETL